MFICALKFSTTWIRGPSSERVKQRPLLTETGSDSVEVSSPAHSDDRLHTLYNLHLTNLFILAEPHSLLSEIRREKIANFPLSRIRAFITCL